MPSLKTTLLMDTEPYDAALVRSRAAAAVAGQDITRSLQLKISAMEATAARLPAGAERMRAEEDLWAAKMRLAGRTQKAITAMEIAENEKRAAAGKAADIARIGAIQEQWLNKSVLMQRLAALRAPQELLDKQNAYLLRKAEIMGATGSGMAPGFAKLLATEAAIANPAIAQEAAFKKAAEIALLTKVARGYGAGVGETGNNHGGGGISGIIRESLVIVREFFRGNTNRIAGSVTLLAQYLGLLGTVIKSTAAEAVMASAAATKLSQSMAAAAVAAEAKAMASIEATTAEGADAVATKALAEADVEAAAAARAAALAQEAKAAAAAEAAEIARASAVVTIGPIGWVVAAVVALGAIVGGLIYVFHKTAERARNLAEMLDPLTKKFTEQADALREQAKTHQEYLDWLKKVGDETETLPEKIDRVIQKMREQASAEEELARAQGKGAVDILGLKKAELKAEWDLLAASLATAVAQSNQAQDAADAAEKAMEAFDPTAARGAKRAATNAGAILDAVEGAVRGKTVREETGTKIVMTTVGPQAIPSFTERPMGENDAVNVKVNGQELRLSLKEAKAAYDKATDLAQGFDSKQAELKSTLANAKLSKEEKDKAVTKLEDEISTIQTQLNLANTVGAQTAALEDARRPSTGGHGGRGGLNADQRIGAYVVANDLTRIERHLAHIETNTQHLAPPAHPAVATTPPKYGGVHQ